AVAKYSHSRHLERPWSGGRLGFWRRPKSSDRTKSFPRSNNSSLGSLCCGSALKDPVHSQANSPSRLKLIDVRQLAWPVLRFEHRMWNVTCTCQRVDGRHRRDSKGLSDESDRKHSD